MVCSCKEQNKCQPREIATYSRSKQMQFAVLWRTTCWYRWRSTFFTWEPHHLGRLFEWTRLQWGVLVPNLSSSHSDLLPKTARACRHWWILCISRDWENENWRSFTDMGYFRKSREEREEDCRSQGNINIVSQMHLRFPYALQIQFPWWSTHLLSLFTLPHSPLDFPPTWDFFCWIFKLWF